MFWETKLIELEKLGKVELSAIDTGGFKATLGTASFNGLTRAAAVCELWTHVSTNHFTIGERVVRWNGKWEDVEPPKKPEPELPVVEEAANGAFDPAD